MSRQGHLVRAAGAESAGALAKVAGSGKKYMVKKNIKMLFGDSGEVIEDKGGIPLSVGEVMKMHQADGSIVEYEVISKEVDCRADGEDWIVDVVFSLRANR